MVWPCKRGWNELGFKIPVIMLTGHGDVPMAVQAMKAGAVDFIQKPYRDQVLLDSINAALSFGCRPPDMLSSAAESRTPACHLDERERGGAQSDSHGSTSKEIACELRSVSPRTVEGAPSESLALGIAPSRN